MKLQPKSIDAFLHDPPAGCNTVLIYGPDSGMVRVRKEALLKGWKVAKDDPFCYTELTMQAVETSPPLLHEALCAMTLTGDAPCTVVTDATDKLTSILKEARTETAASNRLIILAGDLPKKSSLRALCEDMKHKQMAAIACYRDEGAGLSQVIRQFMQERAIQCSPQVMQLLVSLLGNDRAITLSELEKIDIYLGKERLLQEDDVVQLLTDNRYMILSDAVIAWFCGDMPQFYRLTDRVFAEGESPVALIRVAFSIAGRLLTIRQAMAEGAAQEQALNSLKPPVFFKDIPHYSRALQRWTVPALLQLYQTLEKLEIAVKRNSAYGDVIMMHEMHMLSIRQGR